jgi:hypothetical protein
MNTATGTNVSPIRGNSATSVRFRDQLARNIRRACNTRGITPYAAAKAVGMTENRMDCVLRAETPAHAIEIALLSREFGISADSLLEGCL